MPELKKPTNRLYQSFLYLNGDEVINSLSALEGGDVDEILIRSAEEGSSGISGQVDAKVAKGKGGRKKARRFEEEMRQKRTTHSAARTLLRKLHDEDAIGVVTGDYDASIYPQLEDHMTLEFNASIRIHPAHQMVAAGRSIVQRGAIMGMDQQEITEIRESVEMFAQLTQGGPEEAETMLIFAETAGTTDGHLLALPIRRQHLLVPLDEFSGRATFVAQVDRILGDEEEVSAIRFLSGPVIGVEREALSSAVPELMEPMREMGVDVRDDDMTLRKPTVILKPICIFK